jgi:dihydroceramidase
VLFDYDWFGKVTNMFTVRVTLLFLVLSLIILAITVTILTSLAPAWETWEPATCMPAKCFCEAIQFGQSIRQPANTWSSLVYVLVGALTIALTQAADTVWAELRLTKSYSIVLGLSIILIGVGSAFYHASLTFIGQFSDVLGMYLLTSFMLVYAWERLFDLNRTITLIVYFLINLVLVWFLIKVPETRRYLFGLVLIAAMIFEYLMRRFKKPLIQVRWWHIGFSLFTIAYVIWILDISKTLCEPYSYLQGHAIWHVLGAVAIWFLYYYYVSESTVSREENLLV